MKKLFSAVTLLALSYTTAFASETVRYETHTRTLSEQVIAVGECQDPTSSSYATTVLKQNSRGEIYSAPATAISAETKLAIQKCQQNETFKVQVTGSFWNSKDSEMLGTGEKGFVTATAAESFSDSETLQINGGTTIIGSDGLDTALAVRDGLIARVKAKCEAKRKTLLATVSATSACSQ